MRCTACCRSPAARAIPSSPGSSARNRSVEILKSDPDSRLRSGLARVALGHTRESGERLGGDVMLDAFGIGARHLLGHADGAQKLEHDLVTALGLVSDAPAFVGEEDGAVRLRRNQPRGL